MTPMPVHKAVPLAQWKFGAAFFSRSDGYNEAHTQGNLSLDDHSRAFGRLRVAD